MAGEAITLAIASGLHFSIGTSKPSPAGIAEAILCLALGYGWATILRGHRNARRVAAATVAPTILGFCIGIANTARGDSAADLAYHATMLPILGATLAALLTTQMNSGASG